MSTETAPPVTPEIIRGCFVYLEGICIDGPTLVVYDEAQYSWLMAALMVAPYYSDQGRDFWSRYDDGAADALRGVLVSLNLIEYGTSPRVAWLSFTGAAVLEVFKALPDDYDTMPDDPMDGVGWCAAPDDCTNCDALKAFTVYVDELRAFNWRKD